MVVEVVEGLEGDEGLGARGDGHGDEVRREVGAHELVREAFAAQGAVAVEGRAEGAAGREGAEEGVGAALREGAAARGVDEELGGDGEEAEAGDEARDGRRAAELGGEDAGVVGGRPLVGIRGGAGLREEVGLEVRG